MKTLLGSIAVATFLVASPAFAFTGGSDPAENAAVRSEILATARSAQTPVSVVAFRGEAPQPFAFGQPYVTPGAGVTSGDR